MVKTSRCKISDRSSDLVWRIIWIHTLSKFKDGEKEIVQSFNLRVFGGNGAIGKAGGRHAGAASSASVYGHKSPGQGRESSQCGAQGPGSLKRKKMSKGGHSSHPGTFS